MKNLLLLLTPILLGCWATSVAKGESATFDGNADGMAGICNRYSESDLFFKSMGPMVASGVFDELKAPSSGKPSVQEIQHQDKEVETIVMDISSDKSGYIPSLPGNVEHDLAGRETETSFLPLPVVINYFRVTIIDGELVVSWGTTSESSNDHFEIEASLDAKNFKAIGRSESLGKNGDSVQSLDYEQKIKLRQIVLSNLCLLFLSTIPFAGRSKRTQGKISFWLFLFFIWACRKEPQVIGIAPGETIYVRLLQIDKDGTQSYSRIASVRYNR